MIYYCPFLVIPNNKDGRLVDCDGNEECCCNISGRLSTGDRLVLEIDLVIKD
jgi:hypothetical protein